MFTLLAGAMLGAHALRLELESPAAAQISAPLTEQERMELETTVTVGTQSVLVRTVQRDGETVDECIARHQANVQAVRDALEGK